MDLLTVPEGAGALDAAERVGDSGVGELAEAEDLVPTLSNLYPQDEGGESSIQRPGYSHGEEGQGVDGVCG